ncbi:hypothetical protein [Streptomyces sp. NPDC046821]|uniref:hypothetical protein n=1 Tax=Streptomyces sp. NPDC046821 TaxID=3154702 RepID=UPI0033E4B57D
MSLTSQIADRSSPLSLFFEDHLPYWQDSVAHLRRTLGKAPTPVRPPWPDGVKPPWGLIGRGIDERIRLMTGPTRTVLLRPDDRHSARLQRAELGYVLSFLRAALRHRSDEVRTAVEAATAALAASLDTRQGTGAQDEEVLARHCYLAAMFDVRGGIEPTIDWLLRDGAATTLDSWAAAVPDAAVEDLVQLAGLAAPVFAPLAVALPAERKVAAPLFTGSRDVGGADADLILGGMIVDCKATIRPHRIGRAELYQLIGYALLDYDDIYQLDSAALYLARTGTLVRWDLDELLDLTGAEMGIGDLRDALARTLQTARAARREALAARWEAHRASQPGRSPVLAAWREELYSRLHTTMLATLKADAAPDGGNGE